MITWKRQESSILAFSFGPRSTDRQRSRAVRGDVEVSLWLIPLNDRQHQGSLRKGIMERVPLGQYLLLIDYPATMGGSDHSCLSFVGIFREAITLPLCTSVCRDFCWLG